MSRAAALLRSLDGREWTDEDGERTRLELLPPLSDAEIDALAEAWGVPVPREAREVLRVARGLDGAPLESVDFGGMLGAVGMEELFPHAVPIAHDGFGNYWIADLTPGANAFGPIFFLCHDPSVAVYQCDDVAAFLDALVEMTAPPHAGPLDFVHEQSVSAIWAGAETGVPRDVALASDDAAIRGFAASLPEGAFVADLRNARAGDGFRLPLSREFFRHPSERVFAWHTPPSPPGFIARWKARLFGG